MIQFEFLGVPFLAFGAYSATMLSILHFCGDSKASYCYVQSFFHFALECHYRVQRDRENGARRRREKKAGQLSAAGCPVTLGEFGERIAARGFSACLHCISTGFKTGPLTQWTLPAFQPPLQSWDSHVPLAFTRRQIRVSAVILWPA